MKDLSGNPNQESSDTFPGLIVTQFGEDTAEPSVENFELDLNTGEIVITFSEPVRTSDIDYTGITIQAYESVNNANDF